MAYETTMDCLINARINQVLNGKRSDSVHHPLCRICLKKCLDAMNKDNDGGCDGGDGKKSKSNWFGYITERGNDDYPHLKKVKHYSSVVKKKGIDKKVALEEAQRLGWVLGEKHLENTNVDVAAENVVVLKGKRKRKKKIVLKKGKDDADKEDVVEDADDDADKEDVVVMEEKKDGKKKDGKKKDGKKKDGKKKEKGKKKKRGRPKKDKQIHVKEDVDIVSDMIQHAIQGALVQQHDHEGGDNDGDGDGDGDKGLKVDVVEFALDNNNTYLKDQHNIIYDIHTNEPIGVYHPESKEIEFHQT